MNYIIRMNNLSPFVKYKDIFGQPSKGSHSIRFMNVAIVDYILTIILAFFITFLTEFPIELSTILCFVIGIISHILFGVPTTTTKYLNMNR